MLYTTDLQETVDFYVQILGFRCEAIEQEWGWASVSLGAVSMMFSLPNEHIPFNKPTFTGSFYLKTEEIDAVWNSLKERTNIAYSLETFEYGMREFAIYDNNGYLLQFGQETTPTGH